VILVCSYFKDWVCLHVPTKLFTYYHSEPFFFPFGLQFANAGAELEVVLHLFTALVLSVSYSKVIWLVTFAAVLCLGLDIGLVIAMGFTFFVITIRSHRYL